MPIREKRRETAAGLFVLIGLLMLGALVVQFGRFGDSFKGNYPLSLEFPDAAGIIKGSDVRLRGAKIGTVATNPRLTSTGVSGAVHIEVRILTEAQIPRNSTFQIGSVGFMGDTFIDIRPPKTEDGTYYEPGESIIGSHAGGFDSIKKDVENIAKNASTLVEEAKETLGNINTALSEINQVGKNLNTTTAKVNSHFFSEKNLANFSNAITNLEAASEGLNPTITEAKQALANLNKAASSADSLFANTQKEIQHIEPALRGLPKAVKSITRAANKADKTMDALQDKNGVIGAFAHDAETGTNTKDFIRNLKRYGILRYRDDATKEERDPRAKFRGTRR